MLNRPMHLLSCITVLAATPAGAAQPPLRDDATLGQVAARLVDQSGRPVSPDRLAGKFVLVNFMFTGCGTTCPTQMAELAKFERSLPHAVRQRLFILSISVDPANDTPRQLKTYAETFGIDGRRWALSTGKLADIVQITRAFAAMRPGVADRSFHTSDVRLFDPRQRMLQRYAAAPLAARQLRADLLALTARS